MNWSNPFVTKPIKTIKPGDKMFNTHNGFISSGRASIEIDPRCPQQYANIIAQCYDAGWIKPVAHVTEKEYMLLGLNHGDL